MSTPGPSPPGRGPGARGPGRLSAVRRPGPRLGHGSARLPALAQRRGGRASAPRAAGPGPPARGCGAGPPRQRQIPQSRRRHVPARRDRRTATPGEPAAGGGRCLTAHRGQARTGPGTGGVEFRAARDRGGGTGTARAVPGAAPGRCVRRRTSAALPVAARQGGGTARPGHPSARPLSAAERRVASLAALGNSNREIADQLCVTISTVEQHLTRVYRKLNVTRRAELPREFKALAVGSI
ncbi:hypothetical protein F6456_38940 [Streptomyces sp. LBUM 1484]|nr:hypothetical protein [Streptomyces sp. LBUM 1484]